MIDTTFTRTVDDLVLFQMRYLKNNESIQRCKLIGWLSWPIVFGFFGVLTYLSVEADEKPSAALFFLSCAIIYALIYPLWFRWRVGRAIRKCTNEKSSRGQIGDIRNVLSNETVSEIVADSKLETHWRGTEKLDETELHTFLSLSPITAIIWPRNGFRTEDEYRRVVDYAKERFAHFHGPS